MTGLLILNLSFSLKNILAFTPCFITGTRYSIMDQVEFLEGNRVWSALGRRYPFYYFKGCFPQTLLCPFLNALSQLKRGKCSMDITFKYFFESTKEIIFKSSPSEMCSGKGVPNIYVQQIYSRTPMPKCDFNKEVLQLYWNRASTSMFSCKFIANFQRAFSWEHLYRAAFVVFRLSHRPVALRLILL